MSLFFPAVLILIGVARAQDEDEDEGALDPSESTPEIWTEPLVDGAPELAYVPRLRPYVSIGLGAALPLGPSGIGPQARAEFLVETPVWGGRLLPFVAVGGAAPQTHGIIEDRRLPPGEDLRWALTERQLQVALGVHARWLDHGAPYSPELTVAPQLVRLDARMVSAIGEGPDSAVRETATRLGWLAAVGMAARTGRGEAFGRIELTGVPADGVLAGDAAVRSITPLVGFRVPL